MKKSNKLFVFVLFALVSTILITSFVSAATPDFLNKASDIFTKWENGQQIGENITKYLVWIMVALLIFAILKNVPLVEEESMLWVRVVLSILISFLSIAYLTPQDLYVMLASYNALGVVLAGIVPFILMVYFSITINKEGSVGTTLFTKFAWILFIIYLVYKLLWGWNEGLISGAMNWIYIALIALGILYVFVFEKKIVNMIFKEGLTTAEEKSKKLRITELEAKLDELRNRKLQPTVINNKGSIAMIDGYIKQYEAELKKLKGEL